MVELVSKALRAARLDAGRLKLEITEGLLLKDTVEVLTTLHQLRQLGASIAMDDFGTGYSSLGYICKFPFNKAKIDRFFVPARARGGVGQPSSVR